MKITKIKVKGFGIWKDLDIEDFSDHLSVFYGPNEAGKTTLMHFVRAILYGFSLDRRKRYFPPLDGGLVGGSLAVSGANGSFEIARFSEGSVYSAPEELEVIAADGTVQGQSLVNVLLAGVDESIYNNVFAVGLREIQELATLNDTDAADQLYALSSGLDRVSLVEVMRELESSRSRILSSDGRPSQVTKLLEERERLRAEVQDRSTQLQHWLKLSSEKNVLERTIARLKDNFERTEQQKTVAILASRLQETWTQRQELSEMIDALGPLPKLAPKSLEQLEEINLEIQKLKERSGEIKKHWRELRDEAVSLPINEKLRRQSARVEAFGEQQSWIAALNEQIGQLSKEVDDLELGLAEDRKELGIQQGQTVPEISPLVIKRLRGPARAVREQRQELIQAEQKFQVSSDDANRAKTEIEVALASHGSGSLLEMLETAGNSVSMLRRRVQLQERLEQLNLHRVELEDQSHTLIERKVLPTSVLAGLGGVFALGVMLILTAVFGSTFAISSAFGWCLALLGVGGIGTAIAGKFYLERSAALRLDACSRQLDLLKLQIAQAKEERTELDGQLPQGGGPLVTRMQVAENDLAALESLLPLDVDYKKALQEVEVCRQRVTQLKGHLKTARLRWQETLQSCGLPDDLSPRQIKYLSEKSRSMAEREKLLEYRTTDLTHRRRELASMENRLSILIKETGIETTSENALEMLHRLSEEFSNQRQLFSRYNKLSDDAKQLRSSHRNLARRLRKLNAARRNILVDSNVSDENEFRELVAKLSEKQLLQNEHSDLSEKIQLAIDGICSLESIEKELNDHQGPLLKSRESKLHTELAHLQNELGKQYERRGKLAEQMQSMVDDKRMLSVRLELESVECRLVSAIERWQTLAVTSHILESIREIYETERQPLTLAEASNYLEELTEGHYTRIWTPLGEDVLRVDDTLGNALPLEVLSRGTREQVFLSLRLALAATYARRGAILPLILDDVLVNFDVKRAKSAAKVLRDFAKEGHQLLVFTCHEHIMKIFKALKIEVRELPARLELDEREEMDVAAVEKIESQKSSRKKKKLNEEPIEIEESDDNHSDDDQPSEIMQVVEQDELEEDYDDEDELEDVDDEYEEELEEEIDEESEEYLEEEEPWEEDDDEEAEYEEDEWEEEEEVEIDAWDEEESEGSEAA